MVTLCSFKCAWCSSKSRLEKSSVVNNLYRAHKKQGHHQHWLQQNQIYNCFGVRIWFEKGHWRLAHAASLLMVPPTLSQAFFPWWQKNSIQLGCGSCFDEISDLLSFWSSYIVLLSHHWNRTLCAEMEIPYWRSAHESALKNCTP